MHVSDYISKTIGQIRLLESQITQQLTLPAELHLLMFEAWKITYPGKGFDKWWDLDQLIDQLKHTIKVFNHMHPDHVGIFVFDRLSAYGGFAQDALNVHNMNMNPGNKQRKLHNTVIPISNPDPAPGKDDTHGQVQKMCFLDDYIKLELRGQPKGIKIILQECKSVWDKYMMECKKHDSKVIRKCVSCVKSQSHKDTERHIMFAEAVGQNDPSHAEEVISAHSVMPSTSDDKWCCMQCVLLLQEDF